MKETIMYCHELTKMDGVTTYYCHFNVHPRITYFHNKDNKIFKALVRELKEGENSGYWAWWINERDRFEFCYYSRKILGMIFPYGVKAAEEHGDGLEFNVMVEILEEVEISDMMGMLK